MLVCFTLLYNTFGCVIARLVCAMLSDLIVRKCMYLAERVPARGRDDGVMQQVRAFCLPLALRCVVGTPLTVDLVDM